MTYPFKTIRVMGKRVRMNWDATLPDKDWGEYDPNTATISVAPMVAIDEKKETVLHEILHAIETMSGNSIPETYIRALSVGLFAVLRDNKTVTQWILEETDDEQ